MKRTGARRKKTADGLGFKEIGDLALALGGTVRQGTKHNYIIQLPTQRAVPLAESTHAQQMLMPYFRQATDYSNREILDAMRRGAW